MSLREFAFPSCNKRDTVKAWCYTPLCPPKAIIHLIHGYGEHSRRYLHMIGAFQAEGYVVYADDHIGHGKTGVESHTLGDPHSGGYKTYLEDEKALHDIAVEEYPDIPYIIFGHSWGSMIARGYAALYGEDIAALILCGVVSQFKGCEVEYADEDFKKAYETDPYQPAGEWFEKVFCHMTDRIPQANGPSDWIACDPGVVSDHAADIYNSFDTTLELLWDLVALYHFIENEEWASMVPSKIPVYLIAGDQDPCGHYGEGLYHVANLLASHGNPVKVKAYAGYRHEIHNEPELREEVEKGLIKFIHSVTDPES